MPLAGDDKYRRRGLLQSSSRHSEFSSHSNTVLVLTICSQKKTRHLEGLLDGGVIYSLNQQIYGAGKKAKNYIGRAEVALQ